MAGSGFAGYVRILHPVPVHQVERGDEEEYWRWSDVAARQGRTMHPLVQWNRLADLDDGPEFPDGWKVGQTEGGFLGPDLLSALNEHLAAVTSVPDDLVMGLWVGWGELHGSGAVYVGEGGDAETDAAMRAWQEEQRRSVSPDVARAVHSGAQLRLPGREYLLFRTSVGELRDPTWPYRAGIGWTSMFPGPAPQLIWPTDHTWVVASEIDWDSTVVAGPRSLVDAVLGDERFEAYEVGEDSDLSWEGDLINPPRVGWRAGP